MLLSSEIAGSGYSSDYCNLHKLSLNNHACTTCTKKYLYNGG